jgi:ribosomal protein S1
VHVGQVYRFKVIEFKEGGRNIIVSRRRQLEEEQRANADEIRKSIVPGAVVTGRVVSVPDFGAFVDVGGVQGLLHVSEMSWTRITNPNEVVAPGDQITVRVLRVDEATGKIALGLKQLQDDPWTAAGTKFPVGQVRTGRVSRIAEFGVFVELEPGFTALLPLAETGTDRGADIRKAFPIGSDVEVVVLEVDAPARRVRVSKRAVAEQREQAELRDYTDRQSAAPSESMGSIADKLRDALGRRE